MVSCMNIDKYESYENMNFVLYVHTFMAFTVNDFMYYR